MLLAHLYDKLFSSKEFLTDQYQYELKLLEAINSECPKFKDSSEAYNACVNKYKNFKTEYTNFVQLMIEQRENVYKFILRT